MNFIEQEAGGLQIIALGIEGEKRIADMGVASIARAGGLGVDLVARRSVAQVGAGGEGGGEGVVVWLEMGGGMDLKEELEGLGVFV